jgi:hypothetical protein
MSTRARLATGFALMFLASAVQAGELLKSASVFETPNEASRQLGIAARGEKLPVTGALRTEDDGDWRPVGGKLGAGWVRAEAIRLAEGDVGYDPSPRKRRGVDLFGSLGPAATITSSRSTFGARLTLGGEILLLQGQQLILGAYLGFPVASGEQATDGGTVFRTNLLGMVGWFLIPERLYVRGALGFGNIYNLRSNASVAFGISGLASAQLGYLIPIFNGGSKLGVEAAVDVASEASDLTGLTTAICSTTACGKVPGAISPSASLVYQLVF